MLLRTASHAALTQRLQPAPARPLLPQLPRARMLRVLASSDASSAGGAPGKGPAGQPPFGSSNAPVPPPGVPLRTAGGPSSGGGAGTGDAGKGRGGGNKGPVGLGDLGGLPDRQGPGGWTWRQIFFVALGFAATLPLFNYVKEQLLSKPGQPSEAYPQEGAKEERSKLGQFASSVKSSAWNPLRSTASKVSPPKESFVEDVKRSEPVRGVQHKAEDVKDKADIKFYDTTSKADRGYGHAQKEVKQTAEDVREKGGNVAAAADRGTHKTSVKGGRVLGERLPEKATDLAYDTEKAAKSKGKGVLEGIKGGATRVGRALHIVADSTESGAEKATKKAEKAIGARATKEQKRNAYYAAGGVALGLTAVGALYYYDRQGGDLGGKMRKLQGKTYDFTTKGASTAQDAATKTAEKAADKGKESLDKAKAFAAEKRAAEPAGLFKQES